MELLILNTDLEAVAVLDSFESLIWNDRYCGYGDFEIYTPATQEFLSILRQDYYLTLKDSEHAMIVEDLQIKSDVEQGNRFIVTGRSLESILDRRIVWDQTILTGNLQNGIEQLLNENIISPTITDRTISNFVFEASTDPVITALTVDAQFTRTNLYTTIQKICAANNIGFKITLSSDTGQFVFKLYAGVDRSYEQTANPYVVFSPKFENLISSDYAESKKGLRTVTIVAGEGEGTDRKTTVVGTGAALERREVYTDARDLSQTVDGEPLTDEEYLAQLTQRGVESLSGYRFMQSFEGQVDPITLFKYGEDFFLGDVVQIASDYGIGAKSRVVEIIHSQNEKGIDIYPTFAMDDVTQIEPSGVLTPGSGGTTETAAQILAKILTVDGADSGLDADLLDGKHAADLEPKQMLTVYSKAQADLPATYPLGISTLFVRPTEGWPSYGTVMTCKTYATGEGTLQIYTPDSPSLGGTSMKIRFGNYDVNNGNSWTDWKIIANGRDASMFSWGTNGSPSGYYKIKIKSLIPWMLFFKLRVYQNYCFYEVNISGYWYSTNHWYSPKAVMVSKSDAITFTLYFGYDSDNTLWIAFPCNAYTGILISDVTNGYSQINGLWQEVFELVNETSLTGTIQTTLNL